MQERTYNWQQEDWPKATVNRAALRDELKAFKTAFTEIKKVLAHPQDPEVVARALADEAVRTSAIEGVVVDESVVMSSICRALGVAYAPKGFAKDARAEGVAAMMLLVREDWRAPVSVPLVRRWHRSLMSGDGGRVSAGAFREQPVYVVRRLADGTQQVRFEAPPSEAVAKEMRRFAEMWKSAPGDSAEVALKAALLHPHFESIHPFEDGNGRVGRALVAKTLAEGLGVPLVLPVSTVIARHRAAYYDEINEASKSLDWTNWCAFFVPVLTELLTGFCSAARFVSAKGRYLAKYEKGFSARARKVILRMFENGETGVLSGLSSAKWVRMAKVSKATATRDLAELVSSGAILPVGEGASARYVLNGPFAREPIEPLNEPLNEWIVRLVGTHPGVRLPYLKSVVGKSTATVKRAVSSLVSEGLIEHRGSKKTGGYHLK